MQLLQLSGSPAMAVLMYLSYFVFVVAMTVASRPAPSEGAPRALFVFGDSLVDNGNNNYLLTTARADSPPYGIDFPTHRPTGRFSNGFNIPDIISEHLGAEPTLPYLSPELEGQRLLVGANFASAGVGILNDTGNQFVNLIRISNQLSNFEDYQKRLSTLVGEANAKTVVERAVVLITLGDNDFVNNYFLVPFSLRSREFALPDYVSYLISQYKLILQRLYGLGARQVVVTGTGPMGCAPSILATRSPIDGECSAELQRAAEIFNAELVQMLEELNRQYVTDSPVFLAANTNAIHLKYITNPAAYGFSTAKVACCGQGPYNGAGLCTAVSNLCPDRDRFVFWDPFHPSERAARLLAGHIMTGPREYIYPMNLTALLAIQENAAAAAAAAANTTT